MMNVLDRAYIWTTIRLSSAKDRMKEFLSDQDGISNVVAVIIVLLITVLLIGVFWDRLQEWINDIMNDIFGTTFSDSGLDKLGG